MSVRVGRDRTRRPRSRSRIRQAVEEEGMSILAGAFKDDRQAQVVLREHSRHIKDIDANIGEVDERIMRVRREPDLQSVNAKSRDIDSEVAQIGNRRGQEEAEIKARATQKESRLNTQLDLIRRALSSEKTQLTLQQDRKGRIEKQTPQGRQPATEVVQEQIEHTSTRILDLEQQLVQKEQERDDISTDTVRQMAELDSKTADALTRKQEEKRLLAERYHKDTEEAVDRIAQLKREKDKLVEEKTIRAPEDLKEKLENVNK